MATAAIKTSLRTRNRRLPPFVCLSSYFPHMPICEQALLVYRAASQGMSSAAPLSCIPAYVRPSGSWEKKERGEPGDNGGAGGNFESLARKRGLSCRRKSSCRCAAPPRSAVLTRCCMSSGVDVDMEKHSCRLIVRRNAMRRK